MALSPPGSSTYSSNTLYVGDGTWDSSRNTFLLPNLVGFNFDTMVYNGMGNRFASLDEYHVLIQGHGILAVITFLFILPASIMIQRFRGRGEIGSSNRIHVYLNILALFLSTVVFVLGWFAVGPNRSLTNPHHGIGLTIYILILVQTIGGAWVRGKVRKRRALIKGMLHQWLGRAIVLLGIAQVPLGLTLYGSPRFTFVLYTLWMTFLLVLYFILSHRAEKDVDFGRHRDTVVQEGTVIEERKSGGIGRYLAPLAAGAGIIALLNRRKSKRESRDSRVEVLSSRRGSRRGSGSFDDEEKYSDDRDERRGGLMDKLLAGAAVVGAGALAKRYFDRRRNKDEEAYSAVAPDTPSRRRRPRPDDSEISEDTVDIRRVEEERRHGSILPGPGDPLVAATAISAAQDRPITPRPIGIPAGRNRRDSFSSYTSTASPSRREERKSHTARNAVLGGIGLGWLAKKYKDRRDRQEDDRLDRIRQQDREDERRLESERRHGNVAPRYTGDGTPKRASGRRTEISESDLSSELTESLVEPRRGPMPPLAAGALAAAAGATLAQSRSRHDVIEPVPMPPMEPRPFHESGSEAYFSSGGQEHRRHRSRVGEEAAAATAAGIAAEVAEEDRRRRERSRGGQSTSSPPVAVSLKVHGDRDRNVTLRRLTEEEAAAERIARQNASRRRRADSVSSFSGTETAASNRRYRRDQSARRDVAEAVAEQRVEAEGVLSPPRPAFAAGRQPKDSSYFSGPPPPPPESLGSPGSHGTWSGVSPSGTGTAAEDPAERRRRRRLERNQRQASGTVEYT